MLKKYILTSFLMLSTSLTYSFSKPYLLLKSILQGCTVVNIGAAINTYTINQLSNINSIETKKGEKKHELQERSRLIAQCTLHSVLYIFTSTGLKYGFKR